MVNRLALTICFHLLFNPPYFSSIYTFLSRPFFASNSNIACPHSLIPYYSEDPAHKPGDKVSFYLDLILPQPRLKIVKNQPAHAPIRTSFIINYLRSMSDRLPTTSERQESRFIMDLEPFTAIYYRLKETQTRREWVYVPSL